MRIRTTHLLLVLALAAPSAHAQESKLDGLRSAAKAAKDDAGAALALGRALRRSGHYGEAEAELRRGALLAGARAGATAVALRWELARAYIDERKHADALTACKALAPIAGGAGPSHACAAEAHMLRRRASEALPEVEAALKASPGLYEAKVVEGDALLQQQSIEAAEKTLREAIASDEKRIEAHLELGSLLDAQGRRDAAQVEYQRAHELDPDDADASFALGRALGGTQAAADALAAAVASRPGFGAAWAKLADAHLALGHTADAEKAAQEAVKLDGKQAEWRVALARVYEAEKRHDDAIREARAALGVVSNLGAAKLVEADALAGKGDIDLAIEAYQVASGLQRSDPAPVVNAAAACLAAGRETSARGFADRATQLFPKWGPAFVVLGDVLAKAKDAAGARTAYQTALSAEGPVDRADVQRKLAALK